MNKAHVDSMLSYYVTVTSPLVSALIDMCFYDSPHTSVSDLNGNSPVGHTWNHKFAQVKHVDGDGINCLSIRVGGSRGSCMFLCTHSSRTSAAVFLCTRIEPFKSPLGSIWCCLFANDDGSYDPFIN